MDLTESIKEVIEEPLKAMRYQEIGLLLLNGSNVDTIEISFMMMRNTRNLFKITKKRKKTLKKDCMNL